MVIPSEAILMPKKPALVKTKVASVRVPETLPARIKAATGLSFSAAITQFFVPFLDNLARQQQQQQDTPSDDTTS